MKKNTILTLALILSLGMIACKSKSKVNSSTTTSGSGSNSVEQSSNQGKIKGYRFIVSFISVGSGADNQAISKLEKIASDYKGNPQFEVVSWGREGEKDYCFSLNQMNSTEQTQFIEKVKMEFKGNSLVQFRENGPAKGVRE